VPTIDVEAAAYHQAGHAVADLHFGFRANPLALAADAFHCLGHAQRLDGKDYRDANGQVDPQQVGNAVIVWLAGSAAEREYSQAATVHPADWAKATDVLASLGPHQSFPGWQHQAREFVKQNWKAIQMVATDLLENNALDGTELEMIVSIANQEKDARANLIRYRELTGKKQTRQFCSPAEI